MRPSDGDRHRQSGAAADGKVFARQADAIVLDAFTQMLR